MRKKTMPSTQNWSDIRHAELFDRLSPDDVNLILSRSSPQDAPRGCFLYHQGEPAKTMFLIEAGRVRLKEITEYGSEVLIRLIYPGEVFGAVIADALYRATAQADRPVRAHAWTEKAFTELLDRFPRLQKHLFALTKRFMYLSRDRLRMLATASVEHRIEGGRVAQPFGFALTDPYVRLSRIRLFPKVTPIRLAAPRTDG